MAAPVSAPSIHEQNAVPASLYRADAGTPRLAVGVDRVVPAE
jgi:hypothetical protein